MTQFETDPSAHMDAVRPKAEWVAPVLEFALAADAEVNPSAGPEAISTS